MKKLFLFLLATMLTNSVMADDMDEAHYRTKVIDKMSSVLTQRNLHFISTGENKPYISEDNSFVFKFGTLSDCADTYCEAIIASVKETTIDACFLDLPTQPIGVIPVNEKNFNGYFYVPKLSDIEARNKDVLVFYRDKHCFEIAFGYSGEEFDNLKKIANHIFED